MCSKNRFFIFQFFFIGILTISFHSNANINTAYQASNTLQNYHTDESLPYVAKLVYPLEKDKTTFDEINNFSEDSSEQRKSNINWTFVIIGLICLASFSFGGYKLYQYNPLPGEVGIDLKQVKGIITLLPIGLGMTPIILLGKITSGNYFNQFLWENMTNPDSFWYNPFHAYSQLGQFILTILFMVYSTVAFLLFCDRRTSFPMLGTIYYALFGIYIIADALIARYGDFGNYSDFVIYGPAEYAATLFAGMMSVFWIVYLNMSSRVTDLFIFRKGQTKKEVLDLLKAKKERNNSLFLHSQR